MAESGTPRQGGIGIIGSCATRDMWHVLDLPAGHLTLFSRTSLASLTSPVPEPLSLPESMGALDAGGFLARCVRADVGKTALDTLETIRPEFLMFDFIDERFDLLHAGGAIVCDSFEFRRSGLRARVPFVDGRQIRRLSGEADEAWHAGLARLRARIESGKLANARLLLHAALWAERYRKDGALRAFPEKIKFHPMPRQAERIVDHNALLRRYHAAFVKVFPDAIVIEPDAECRLGDFAHDWGLSPYHYVAEYYRSVQALCRGHGVPV